MACLKARRIKIIMLVMIMFVFFIFGLSTVMAFEFDNRLVISERLTLGKYPEVAIKNNFGLGEDLFTAKLISNTENCSIDCEAIILVNNIDSEIITGKDLDDKFRFIFNDDRGKERTLSYNIEISTKTENNKIVSDYSCIKNYYPNSTEYYSCSPIYDNIETRIWESFKNGDKIPKGESYIKIKAKKGKYEFIDWKPYFIDFKVDAWAQWGYDSIGSLQSNVVAWWSLNNTLNATVGSAYNFTGNGTFISAGKDGQAWGAKNSTRQDVIRSLTIAGSKTINGADNFTLNYWWYSNASLPAAADIRNGLVNDYSKIKIFDTSMGNNFTAFAVGVSGVGSNYTYVWKTFNDSQWHMITTIYRRNATHDIYVDGVYEDSIIYEMNDLNDTAFQFGEISSASAWVGEGFYYDEISLFNRSLTANEINFLYNTNILVNNNPINNSNVFGYNLNFSCSMTGSTINVTNISLYIDNKLNYTQSFSKLNPSLSRITTINSNGWHNYSCAAYDNSSNYYSSTISFFNVSYPLLIGNPQYQSQLAQFSSSLYNISINYDDSIYSAAAYLILNGTRYSTDKTSYGNLTNFSALASTPWFPNSVNITGYFEIELINSTGTYYYNSSNFTQQINIALIGSCASYSNLVFNVTIYDEESKNILKLPANNNSFDYYFIYGNSNLSNYVYHSGNITSVSSFTVCSNVQLPTNTRIDGKILYKSTSHVSEEYSVQNYLINGNIPANISLYDLLTTDSQEFLVTYKDRYLSPVENVIIQLDRLNTAVNNSPYTVESPLTDKYGRAILHAVLNDIAYNIYVKKNGVTLATFANSKFFCSTTSCELNLNELSGESTFYNLDSFKGLYYSKEYNKTSRVLSIYIMSKDGSVKNFNYSLILNDAYLNTTICTQSVSTSSATLLCSVSEDYLGKSGVLRMYLDGEELPSDIVNFIEDFSLTFDPFKYIIGFLLLLTLVGLFINEGDPKITLAVFLVGFALCGLLFLIDTTSVAGTTALVWFILSGIFIGIAIARRKQ